MYNKVGIQGRLTADPKFFKGTQEKKAYISFSLACDRNTSEKRADFFDAKAYGTTAEFIQQYFHKGDMILLDGNLATDSWQDKESGKNRTKTIVIAQSVFFCGGKKNETEGDEEELPVDAAETSAVAATEQTIPVMPVPAFNPRQKASVIPQPVSQASSVPSAVSADSPTEVPSGIPADLAFLYGGNSEAPF